MKRTETIIDNLPELDAVERRRLLIAYLHALTTPPEGIEHDLVVLALQEYLRQLEAARLPAEDDEHEGEERDPYNLTVLNAYFGDECPFEQE